MSEIKQIRMLVREGLYYLTEHAYDEAGYDNLDIYDVEHAVLTGQIRRNWPKEGKFEVVGSSLDNRRVGVVCRMTKGNNVRIITVYLDCPKHVKI